MHLTLYTIVSIDPHTTLRGKLLIIISFLQMRKLRHGKVTCSSQALNPGLTPKSSLLSMTLYIG